MLSLIKCEFLKLKRKKLFYFVLLASMLFPLSLSFLLKTPAIMARYENNAELYNELWINTVGFGIQFLLPALLGIIATMIFFVERDNNTFKSLRTIPVTSKQMVLSKITVIFIVSILFAILSNLFCIIFGSVFFEFNGSLNQFWITLLNGIFIAAGTLPLIIVIVLFSREYIFSVLLTVFYTILSFAIIPLNPIMPGIIYRFVPITTTAFWTTGMVSKIGLIELDLMEISRLIPSTLNITLYMLVIGMVSIITIIKLYERWEG